MQSARIPILVLLAAGTAHAGEQPIDIHFTSRATVVDGKAMKAAAKAREAEAGRKAKELEKAYSAQYGKDKGKWPRDKRDEVGALDRDARHDEGAEIEADYAGAPPEKLADSARDLAKGAGGRSRGLLRVVERAEDAHLVVEVTGRHSSKSDFDKLIDDQFGFILRLSAGGKLAADRLRKAEARWPDDEERDVVTVNELHGYSDDEPFWLLQCQGGATWKDLANNTDAILADWALANASLIVGK